jgi:hypothetical protein
MIKLSQKQWIVVVIAVALGFLYLSSYNGSVNTTPHVTCQTDADCYPGTGYVCVHSATYNEDVCYLKAALDVGGTP